VARNGPKKNRTKAELLRDLAKAARRVRELDAALEQREQNENSLRLRADRCERIFESAKDGIVLLNGSTGSIEQLNNSFTELTGHAAEQLLGKALWEISPLSATDAGLVAFRELQTRDHIYYDDLPL
jgi:PAS domain-containing protein